MTSQPVTYEPFPDVDEDVVEGEADWLNPVRGVVMGVALSAPLWAGVYWLFRSL